MAQVILERVTKKYEDVVAVDGIDLSVADRELIVLVGPSGCGKSTTLRLIAGLEAADSGTIRIGERVVNDVAPKDRNLAMVFQNYALYPHMTVFKNLAFGLKMRRTPRREVQGRVLRTAQLLEIDDLLDRKPGQLSGGQRQRVALGRAIVRDPEVFLFDEPLSNLDAQLRVTMRAELLKLHERLQTTMIYVTHDQTEAMTMGDRIVVMQEGVIRQIGTPLDVYREPANRFIGEFIGNPPMNFVEGRLVHEAEELRIDCKDIAIRLPIERANACTNYIGQPVTLGFRPENVRCETTDNIPADAIGRAQVVLEQSLGSDTLWELELGSTRFTARVDARPRGAVDVVSVWIDPQHCRLFDAKTGDAIGSA